MATELGAAYISVGLGTNRLAGEIRQAFGSAGSAGDAGGRAAGGGFASGFKALIGPAIALVSGAAIGGFIKDTIAAAGNLEQSVGAIDAVFKGSAGQMHDWAGSAATNVGLTKNEFNELGTLIGAQLKNGGTAMDELAPKTNDLITLGADLSSMFGGTTADAVGALSSALKGERDPIERYGVSLNQAKIDAEAAALGFEKVGGSLSTEANQAATLSLIMKQTADAHGNFGRETDTLAHKQQVLNAQWSDAKARIGTELLPAAAALTGALSSALGPAVNGLLGIMREANGGFQAFRASFKAADGDITSSGFAGVMERIGYAAAQVKQALGTIWAGFKMPPDIVAGLGDKINPLLKVGADMRKTFEQIMATLAPVGVAMGAVFASVGPQLAGVLPLLSPFGLIFQALLPVLPQVASLVATLATQLGSALGGVLAMVVPVLGQLVSILSGVFVAILPIVSQLITAVGGAIQTLVPVVMGLLAAILPLVMSLVGSLAPILIQLVQGVMPPVISIFSMLVAAIGPLITTIAGVLIPIIQALMPVVVTVFGVIASVVTSVMQVVQGIIQVVTGIISGNWSQVWDGIKNIFTGVWNTIGAIVSGAVQILWSVIQAALGIIASIWSGAWNGIKSILSGAWDGIKNGVSSGVGAVVDFVRGLPGKVVDVLGNMGSTLLNSGKALMQGFLDGIMGMVGTIKDKVSGVVQSVRDFFPFSPAKTGPFSGRGYTTYSGKALATDFAKSIEGEKGRVQAAAAAITGAATLGGSARFMPLTATPGTVGRGTYPAAPTINVHESANAYSTAVHVARLMEVAV